MLISDLYRLSFHNLLQHKVRSGLTSLGVIFGIASVIAMLAISEGARIESLSQIQSMGINNVIIYTKEPSVVGKGASSTDSNIVNEFGITKVDIEHLELLDNIDKITTVTDSRQNILSGTTLLDLKLIGVEPNFLGTCAARLIKGRWLSTVDNKNLSRVCVVGRNVKRKYFGLGELDIIGKSIAAKDSVWTIVGVVEDDTGTELANMGSINNMVLVPSETLIQEKDGYSYSLKRRNTSITIVRYDAVIAQMKELRFINNTASRITNYMNKAHKKSKDWDIIIPYSLFKQRQKTQQIFTIVMGSIAGISLIVGGVGIMNIMLASVFERRKEIGTRRALGAKKTEILMQFLVETVTLTALGSLVGIATGIALAQSVAFYAGWPVVYSYWIMLAAFFIACTIGIVFGTYPAMKAAAQNPIDVLRTE